MASIIAHPFVALALSPVFRRFGIGAGLVTLGAVCTVVPDLDVIGFRMGIPYDSLYGHRGFSHSLLFAALLAAALTLLVRIRSSQTNPVALFIFLFLCTASHGVLDAFTSGGHGIAFFSPLSEHRHFFEWRPIRVSPLSISQFLSGRGKTVLISEFKWVILPSLVIYIMSWLAMHTYSQRTYANTKKA